METANAPRPRRWRWLMFVPVAVVVMATLGVLVIARNVHIQERGGKDFSIDLPGGQFRLHSGDKADPGAMGVPRYPGAQATGDSGSVAFSWSSSNGREEKNLAVAGAEFVTRDSVEKVVAFYRDELPNWIIVTEGDGKMRLELRDGGITRIVAIKPQSDGTHIGLATIGKPESN